MPPKKKKIKLNDEETIGWFDIPFEIRENVMKLMDFQTKINFSQCSIDCLEEGQLSKTTLIAFSEQENEENSGCIEICDDYRAEIDLDLSIKHENHSSPTHIPQHEIIKLDKQLKHSFVADSRKERNNVLLQNFRGLLEISRNRLKCLDIDMEGFPYNRIKIGKLPNLQEVRLTSYSTNQSVDPIRCGFIDFEQLCAVKNWVKIPKLSVDQILKIKARLIEIDCEWEREDTEQLIDRILDGELDENVEQIRLTSKIQLKTIPGIDAYGRWGLGQECFAKRDDKTIRIHIELFSIVISTQWKATRTMRVWKYLKPKELPTPSERMRGNQGISYTSEIQSFVDASALEHPLDLSRFFCI